MLFGWELVENGMLGVGEYAQCAWRHGLLVVLRDGFEHPVVPIVGLEQTSHGETFRLGTVGHQQNGGSSGEFPGCLGIVAMGDDDV